MYKSMLPMLYNFNEFIMFSIYNEIKLSWYSPDWVFIMAKDEVSEELKKLVRFAISPPTSNVTNL